LDHLVQGLSKSRTRILIPSPCLTELLVRAGKARDEYVQKLGNSSTFEVIPFDRRAATECALLLADAWDSKTQRDIARTKFKYDWMIVACAASRGVKEIYSDDKEHRSLCGTSKHSNHRAKRVKRTQRCASAQTSRV